MKSNTNPEDPELPGNGFSGMTIRERFSLQFMQALIDHSYVISSKRSIAREAVDLADALIYELTRDK